MDITLISRYHYIALYGNTSVKVHASLSSDFCSHTFTGYYLVCNVQITVLCFQVDIAGRQYFTIIFNNDVHSV